MLWLRYFIPRCDKTSCCFLNRTKKNFFKYYKKCIPLNQNNRIAYIYIYYTNIPLTIKHKYQYIHTHALVLVADAWLTGRLFQEGNNSSWNTCDRWFPLTNGPPSNAAIVSMLWRHNANRRLRVSQWSFSDEYKITGLPVLITPFNAFIRILRLRCPCLDKISFLYRNEYMCWNIS